MGEIKVDRVKCPVCGGNIFDEGYAAKKLYFCTRKNEKGIVCGHIQCYCKTCDKVFDESDFGKHGDIWECKECGNVCWQYTDYMREKIKAEALLSEMQSFDNLLFKW